MNTDVITAISDNSTDALLAIFNTREGKEYLLNERRVPEETIESVSIINVTGARILEFRNIQATDYVLNLDGISAGIYIVEVKTADNKLQISRLVKK